MGGDRVLWLLTLTLCGWVSVFGIAAIISASFRADGSMIVAAILGALTTALSVVGGFAYGRMKANADEKDNAE